MHHDRISEWAKWQAREAGREEGFASAFATFVFFCGCVVAAWIIGGWFTTP